MLSPSTNSMTSIFLYHEALSVISNISKPSHISSICTPSRHSVTRSTSILIRLHTTCCIDRPNSGHLFPQSLPLYFQTFSQEPNTLSAAVKTPSNKAPKPTKQTSVSQTSDSTDHYFPQPQHRSTRLTSPAPHLPFPDHLISPRRLLNPDHLLRTPTRHAYLTYLSHTLQFCDTGTHATPLPQASHARTFHVSNTRCFPGASAARRDTR